MAQMQRPFDDPIMERQVFRKMAIRLLPILMLGMFISYVDRANLGVLAKPMSLDLGLTAAAFGLAAGLFYIGYLVFEIPSNMMLVKVGARLWIARIMVTWGIVTMLMSLIQNEFTLHIMRILLGVAEAGFSPGVYLFLAFWCPPRMLVRAYSLVQVSIPIALAIASALTSSLLLMDGVLGLAGWRWTFLIEGIPAILLAAYIFFALPDRPGKAKWLTMEEKDYLARSVVQPSASAKQELKHLPQAFRRFSAWAFSLTYFCMTIGFWAITYFLPTIVQERFKVGAVESGFISGIPWIISAVAVILVGRSVARTGERTWHMVGAMVVAASGLFTASLTDNAVWALVGITLAAAGFNAVIPTFWTMPAQVYIGGLAAVSIAMINSLGNLSGLAGPVVLGFLKDATGNTRVGLMIMACFFVAAAALNFALSRYSDRHAAKAKDSSGDLEASHV
ncbi:MFS transporter [Sinomonas sp. B1-1]|uniref:MFS transporter n=1 Tax=Sinomonas sp. B1-1 TaxID=3141454 RepID=UPI003D28F5CC